jgi:peptide/nickel transport system permease protein
MGRLFITSLITGDAEVLVVWTVIVAAFVILFNLLADILYGVLDPRIRYA